ncbi:hypothetical protein, partial [Campylobacter coli]
MHMSVIDSQGLIALHILIVIALCLLF